MDRAKLFGIQFRVKNVDEPFDVWIDDIAFVTSERAQASAQER
jgi:hypothetical protein